MATLHDLQLPNGTVIKTALPPERLAALGMPPPSPAPDGRLAFGFTPTGQSQTSPFPGLDQALQSGGGSRSDVPTLNLAPGSTLPVESAESVAASDKTAKQQIDKSREGAARDPAARFGATTKNIDAGGPEEPAPQGYRPPPARSVTIRAKDIKGADIRTGYSTQKSAASDMLPEAEEQQADARINQKLARQAQDDVRAEALGTEMGLAAVEEDKRRAQEAAIQKRIAQRQQAQADLEQRQAQLDQEHDAISKLQVNPNQYWDNASTGGKILAAIGMIAGGIQSGRRGGPNQFAEFIYRAIRDDVAQQREKIEARRQGFQTKRTALDKKAELLHGDLDLAQRELEANGQALAAAIGRKYAAEHAVAGIIPAQMADFAKLDADSAATRLDNANKFGAKVTESFAFTPDRTVTVGGGAPVKDLSRVVEMPDGSKRWARTDAQAKEAQAEVASNSEVASIAARIRAIREAPEDRMPLTAKQEQIRTEAGRLFLAIKRGEALGTLDKGALDFREEFIGKPEALISIGADSKLGVIEQGARERVNNVDRFYLNTDPEGVGRGTGAVTPGRRYEP